MSKCEIEMAVENELQDRILESLSYQGADIGYYEIKVLVRQEMELMGKAIVDAFSPNYGKQDGEES